MRTFKPTHTHTHTHTRSSRCFGLFPCLSWIFVSLFVLCVWVISSKIYLVNNNNDNNNIDSRQLIKNKPDTRYLELNNNYGKDNSVESLRELLKHLDERYNQLTESLNKVNEITKFQNKVSNELQHLHGHVELHDSAVHSNRLINEKLLESVKHIENRFQTAILKSDKQNPKENESELNSDNENLNNIYSENESIQNNNDNDNNDNNDKKEVVPISLLVPCGDKHLHRIAQVMESITSQTKYPSETIFVISISNNTNKAFDFINMTKHSSIPNLKFFMRGGTYFAGSNRQFLAQKANNEMMTFFDCDDYLHPQRIESVYTIFNNNPTLEAFLTGFKHFKRDEFALGKKAEFHTDTWKVDMNEVENFKPIWEYDYLYDQPIISNDWNNRTWDYSDPLSEPNRVKGNMWFFPSRLTMNPPVPTQPHNGWLSIRRDTVFTQIPFPDIARGQDALFNWRLLKSQHNFTTTPFVLGAYLSRNPKGPDIY